MDQNKTAGQLHILHASSYMPTDVLPFAPWPLPNALDNYVLVTSSNLTLMLYFAKAWINSNLIFLVFTVVPSCRHWTQCECPHPVGHRIQSQLTVARGRASLRPKYWWLGQLQNKGNAGQFRVLWACFWSLDQQRWLLQVPTELGRSAWCLM